MLDRNPNANILQGMLMRNSSLTGIAPLHAVPVQKMPDLCLHTTAAKVAHKIPGMQLHSLQGRRFTRGHKLQNCAY